MTEEKALIKLKEIFETVSDDEYPETKEAIWGYVTSDFACLIYEDVFEVAVSLMQTDEAKLMHPIVADFVKEVFEDEIKDDNAAAACNLGALYYTGRMGEQNLKKAVELYTLAANGGDRQAAENLGYCYYYGRDVEIDYEKAFHYFALGAFDGHLVSLYKIGDMYRNGYFVNKNEKEAFYIYTRCVDTMNEDTLYICGAEIYMRIADCYYYGIGTEKNLDTAIASYQKAENLFREKIRNGDFFLRKSYEHCVKVQEEIRKTLESELPKYDWAKF